MSTALQALRALEGDPWLALDTETTGLGPYDVVIEIALVDHDGKILLETTVRPTRPVNKKASSVHGLFRADLETSPPWPQVWRRAQALLRTFPVVAWNAAFDLRLLRQSCTRHRLPMIASRVLCVREAFRQQHPVTRSTLEGACLALGVPERPKHRALPDARVARLVAMKLMGSDPDISDKISDN